MNKIFFIISVVVLALVKASISAPPPISKTNNIKQPQTYNFNISAQDLSGALEQLCAQSDCFISVDESLTKDLFSPNLKKRASLKEALDVLLANTDLSYHITQNKTIIIEATNADSLVIPTIEVVGAKEDTHADSAIMSAGSNSFIGQKEIERFRGTSIGDIFQGESGVLVSENRNSGGLDINIRGMQGQGRVPVLLDGSRQETTVYRGYSGVSSRTYIDPDLISSISINKGPTMDAQATGAIGGLVSMRTIGADDILKKGHTLGLRIKGSLIGNNTGKKADADTVAGLPLGSNTSDGFYWTDCVSKSMCKNERDIANANGSNATLNRPSTFDLRAFTASLAIAKRFEDIDIVAAYATRKQGNYYAGKHGPTPYIDLSERYNKGFYTQVRPKLVGVSRFRAQEMIVNSDMSSTSMLLKSIFFFPMINL